MAVPHGRPPGGLKINVGETLTCISQNLAGMPEALSWQLCFGAGYDVVLLQETQGAEQRKRNWPEHRFFRGAPPPANDPKEQTQMPWWLQAVRHLQDNDGYNLPQQTPRMHVPASPVHSASDDEIDLTHTQTTNPNRIVQLTPLTTISSTTAKFSPM